ncbi:mitochondrial pyruvate carrier [Radiomyces spectabilis]|uniref:mitochondrial pyruvate carrier n=1 Tax=Radiomyces spectabilis TaxID=64574 RepID=UPI00221EC5CD|nr:mitochondrial pyruvate carrier [Radiomyces spectabilis]KAI8368255.1 mitochondrial pyruvate carrier [Radiomyces spectabilis]
MAASAASQSAFSKFINSPAGPKTVHFWAPAMKWALVIAGIGDLQRPADKLSLGQNASLMATGLIWTRYSTVIIPKNWTLFTVNVFVAATGITQVARILHYRQSDEYKAKQAAGEV